MKDYYKILGIEKTASTADIKKAYYYLAKKYHPDNNQFDKKAEKKYLLVCEAYQILGNLDNRLDYAIQLYDEYWQKYEMTFNEIEQIQKQIQK